MEWTIQKTIDLIELYRTSGVLWDPTDENYKNRDKRLDALRNISTTLEVPREEVERKIKNLVGQFSREIKKCKEKSSHGAADGTCESRWFAFKPLLFLKDKKKRLSSNSAIKNDDQMTGNEESDSDLETEESFQEIEASSVTQSPESSTTPKNSFMSTQKLQASINKRLRENPIIGEPCRITKTVYEVQRGRDEYDLFGEQVACKIRKLPTNRVRSNVEQIINTVLWEAELGRYDNYGDVSSATHKPNFPPDPADHSW